MIIIVVWICLPIPKLWNFIISQTTFAKYLTKKEKHSSSVTAEIQKKRRQNAMIFISYNIWLHKHFMLTLCNNTEKNETMTQLEQVIETMLKHGGYATLGELNHLVDVSEWNTKTPFASIRRIVQEGPFFRIRPGLWALEKCRNEVMERFELKEPNKEKEEMFTHSYFQGLLVEIGNMKHLSTYVPPQDRNKKFLEKPLHEMTSVPQIPDFTYDETLRRARTVDVIWFNERKMPSDFFEVEHSTDIQNSLLKFYDLQDFFAHFYIVADASRKNQFSEIIGRNIFSPINKRVRFYDYNSLSEEYTRLKEYIDVRHLT